MADIADTDISASNISQPKYEMVEEIEKEAYKVSKLILTRTGIHVYHCDVSGPLVKGYFALATETHDHDGLPHTLEHLVFMGSQEFPYKGVLDKVANRCLSEGTNAYTDVDHTCYTLVTAGHEGFLSVLPIYLHHILYPTLTDAAYTTEVHHINGKGENAGVVYCEMQDSQSKPGRMIDFELCNHMYPGKCGYKSCTGGRLDEIRNSCSNVKVREYHKKYYIPSNLYLIVCGTIPRDELLDVLFKFEDNVLANGPLPPPIDPPPWSSHVPILEQSKDVRIEFGADDESTGMARIAFNICEGHNLYELLALEVLGDYLTSTSAAPLQMFMIDCADPFANNVSFYYCLQTVSMFSFNFTSVPNAKLEILPHECYCLLKQLGENSTEDKLFNLERLRGIVRQQKKGYIFSLEENAHSLLSGPCIVDSLYYYDKKLLLKDLDVLNNYDKLEREPVDYWLGLLNKYFNEGPHVSCVAVPSKEYAKKTEKEEKDRIEVQQAQLGEEGLKLKETDLDKAKHEHEAEVPSEFLKSLPIPDPSKISMHTCITTQNFPLKDISTKQSDFPVDVKLNEFKLPIIISHVKSQFCSIELLFDSTSLPIQDEVYLPLMIELLLESPISRNGTVIPYEQVTQQLNEDLVEYFFGIGTCCSSRFKYSNAVNCIIFKVNVPIADFELGVQWMHEICYKTQLTEARTRVLIKRMLSSIPDFNRSGSKVMRELLNTLLFSRDVMHNAGNSLQQKKFLSGLLKKLDEDADKVLVEIDRIRNSLFQLKNTSVHIFTNFLRLKSDPLATFTNIFKEQFNTLDSSYKIERPRIKTLKECRLSPPSKTLGLIAGVAGIDSSFFVQETQVDLEAGSMEVCALDVLFSCLSMLEGPLWCEIRGSGLSYSYGLFYGHITGYIFLTLQRSAQLAEAYKVTRDIIMGYAKGERKITQEEFLAGKNTKVYDYVASLSTFVCMADNAWDAELLPGSTDSTVCLKQISQLTLSDIESAANKYLPLIFDSSLTRSAVVANPSKVEQVRADLMGLNCELDLVENVEVFHLGEELGDIQEDSSDTSD